MFGWFKRKKKESEKKREAERQRTVVINRTVVEPHPQNDILHPLNPFNPIGLFNPLSPFSIYHNENGQKVNHALDVSVRHEVTVPEPTATATAPQREELPAPRIVDEPVAYSPPPATESYMSSSSSYDCGSSYSSSSSYDSGSSSGGGDW